MRAERLPGTVFVPGDFNAWYITERGWKRNGGYSSPPKPHRACCIPSPKVAKEQSSSCQRVYHRLLVNLCDTWSIHILIFERETVPVKYQRVNWRTGEREWGTSSKNLYTSSADKRWKIFNREDVTSAELSIYNNTSKKTIVFRKSEKCQLLNGNRKRSPKCQWKGQSFVKPVCQQCGGGSWRYSLSIRWDKNFHFFSLKKKKQKTNASRNNNLALYSSLRFPGGESVWLNNQYTYKWNTQSYTRTTALRIRFTIVYLCRDRRWGGTASIMPINIHYSCLTNSILHGHCLRYQLLVNLSFEYITEPRNSLRIMYSI